MHDAKANAIEIHHLVFLVIRFGRAVEELGTGRPQIRTGACGRIIAATGRRTAADENTRAW